MYAELDAATGRASAAAPAPCTALSSQLVAAWDAAVAAAADLSAPNLEADPVDCPAPSSSGAGSGAGPSALRSGTSFSAAGGDVGGVMPLWSYGHLLLLLLPLVVKLVS